MRFVITTKADDCEWPVQLDLVHDSGAVVVRATRGDHRAVLLRITADGTIYRIRHVFPDLGFALDDSGRVQLEE